MDKEKIIESITTYSKSTGVECILIDHSGKTIHKVRPHNQCDYCEKLMGMCGMKEQCEQAHLYGAYQAERFNDVYIYFCPIGLIHWAVPIEENGMIPGAVLGGHVLMTSPDEFMLEEIMRKFSLSQRQLGELKEYLDSIPIISPERVGHLAKMLGMIAEPFTEKSHIEEEERIPNMEYYIGYLDTMGGETKQEQCYPIDKEKKLLSAIALGDKRSASKTLNEILSYIFIYYGNNFHGLKARILELIILLSRAALEGGADIEQIFGLNYNYLNKINNLEQTDGLLKWMTTILNRFTDCVFNIGQAKHADAIYKSIDYIKRNYMNKITLDEVASYVNFSPSYFCKIFKEEMNSNFKEYLKRVRVSMCKELLKDQELNLSDIALMGGFHDQSHFSKNFKQVTGMSPSKYRNTLRRPAS